MTAPTLSWKFAGSSGLYSSSPLSASAESRLRSWACTIRILDLSATQRGRARVAWLLADPRDDSEEQFAKALVVLRKHLPDPLGRDGLRAFDADVVIRHHRDRRVAELELARENRLGIRGHVDHVEARL